MTNDVMDKLAQRDITLPKKEKEKNIVPTSTCTSDRTMIQKGFTI